MVINKHFYQRKVIKDIQFNQKIQKVMLLRNIWKKMIEKYRKIMENQK